MLNWKCLETDFDELTWTAYSVIHDDGTPFEWVIVVNDAGLFSVEKSSAELTDRKESFETLAAAKAWCQEVEDAAIETAKMEAAFRDHVPTTEVNAEAVFIDRVTTIGVNTETLKPADNYVTDTHGLRWYKEYSGDFVACSSRFINRKPALWQIREHKDGSFQVQTVETNRFFNTFESLEVAMLYCQQQEAAIIEEAKKAAASTLSTPAALGAIIGSIPYVVRNTGNKYWDGQEVYILECPYPGKCRVRSRESGDITWVDADYLVTPSF
jgi:hypothetical protein